MKTGHGYFAICVMSWKGPAWRHEAAHRISYELSVEPILPNMYVLHSCDNGACVRPDHLRLGTQRENILEASQRGRMRRGSSHPDAKLTEKSVEEIREAYAKGRETEMSLAKKYGMSWSGIGNILRGNTWKHIGGPLTPKGVYPNRKLTEVSVAEMRRRYEAGMEITALAQQFGIGRVHAQRVVRKNSKVWQSVS